GQRGAVRKLVALHHHIVLVEAPVVAGEKGGAQPWARDGHLGDLEAHVDMAAVERAVVLAVAAGFRMRAAAAYSEEGEAAAAACLRPFVAGVGMALEIAGREAKTSPAVRI